MTTFSDDLVRSLGEALEHARGKGPDIVHPCRLASRGSGSSPPHPDPNGASGWYEPVGLSKVGTGHSPRQRPWCRIA